MTRGFIWGLIFGTLFGLLVLLLVSLLSEVPGIMGPKAEVETTDAPEISAGNEVSAVVTAESQVQRDSTTPVVPDPSPGAFSVLGPEVTAPAARPVAEVETSAFSGIPNATGSGAQVDVASTDAARRIPQTTGLSPIEPTSDAPTIETQPAEEPAQKPEPDQAVIAAAQPDPAPEPEPGLTTADDQLAGLPASSQTVAVGQLPSVGQQPDEGQLNVSLPAILENALGFDPIDPNLPLVSFVILDLPDSGIGPRALASFEHPLTIVIDASNPGAAQRAKRFHDAGFEIAIQTPIPNGAGPSDVEVAMESYMTRIPQAVAVVDPIGAGFSGDRRIINQVNAILADTGHGMVTQDQGLNTAVQLAARAGIPAKTAARDLDGNNQNATIIRRFVDQAAFKARQNGNVILLARLRADTISALLIWAQQDRAKSVNIAPLSAVLLAD
ncbi:MAG: divergent polysaccharide deacetylase family protein [Planktomarina sp.]